MSENSKYYAIGAGLLGAAAVSVGLIWYYSNNNTGGGGGCNPPCQSNQICVDGVCVSNNPCQGLGNPCTNDSQCGPCESCMSGCCGQRVPYSIQQINIGTYRECVMSNYYIPPFGPCFGGYSWSNCTTCNPGKTDSPSIFTGYLQVVDTAGEPIPCAPLNLSVSNPSKFQLVLNGEYTSSATLSADSTGTLSFQFVPTDPSYGSTCPATCNNQNNQILFELSATVPGTTITLPFLWIIDILTVN